MSHPKEITADVQACSGCLRCALACSYFVSPGKMFNLSKSKITIVPSWDQTHFEIDFTEDCTSCGICVKYCEFGALSSHSKEDVPVGLN